MEHALASDLSRVQIHDNDRAAKLARQARARAFAIGNDVFFARGALRPRDQDGQRLIAHELVHVVQQQRAAATTIRRFHDPSAESVPVGVGEILTQEEFEWTRTGELQLAPGTVAMKVSRDDDQYLVVPRSAVRLNVHGGYDLLTTHEGEKWGAERNAIKEGRRTSAAARRIVGAPEPGSAPPTRIKQSVREQIKRMEEFQSLPWDQQQAAFQAHQKQSEGSFVGYTEEQLRQMEAQEWARKNQKVIDGSGLIDTVQGHEFRQLAREGEVMQSGIVAGGVLSMTGDLGLAETIANIGNMLTQRAARPSKPPVGPVVRTAGRRHRLLRDLSAPHDEYSAGCGSAQAGEASCDGATPLYPEGGNLRLRPILPGKTARSRGFAQAERRTIEGEANGRLARFQDERDFRQRTSTNPRRIQVLGQRPA